MGKGDGGAVEEMKDGSAGCRSQRPDLNQERISNVGNNESSPDPEEVKSPIENVGDGPKQILSPRRELCAITNEHAL